MFSARWTGQIEAPRAGIYTFALMADDGVRLWINNQLIIDNWTASANPNNSSRRIKLTRGQLSDIRVEYFEQTGNAGIRLQWRLPNSLKALEVVPQSNLYP